MIDVYKNFIGIYNDNWIILEQIIFLSRYLDISDDWNKLKIYLFKIDED